MAKYFFTAAMLLSGCVNVSEPPPDGSPVYQPADEPTAPGVEALLSLGKQVSGLECVASSVHWFDGTTRRVVRLSDGTTEAVLDVDQAGDIAIRGIGDRLVVGALGDGGQVWLVGHDGEADAVHAGRVDAVAIHGSALWWYDGNEIHGTTDGRAYPATNLVDLAANSSGPVWFDESGTLRLIRNGEVAEAYRNFTGFYPGTLRGISDGVAWGSDSGAKVLPDETGIIISRENDVDNIGVGGGDTITFCEHVFGSVMNVFAMRPRGEAESVADHETCIETVRCGAHVYWTTERGSLLRAPWPKRVD